MSKEIKLIYQDCAFCHGRESYGEKQMEIARKAGISIKRLVFNELGAPGLIRKAIAKGVDRMPFFTDGTRFSYDLADFLDTLKPAKKAPATPAKAKARAKTPCKEKTTDGNNQSA